MQKSKTNLSALKYLFFAFLFLFIGSFTIYAFENSSSLKENFTGYFQTVVNGDEGTIELNAMPEQEEPMKLKVLSKEEIMEMNKK